MGFQPMQAIFIFQYDAPTQKSKLAARGVNAVFHYQRAALE